MDVNKQFLKGSEKRDIFKQRHKMLDSGFYATDADLCLVSKFPPGIVAYLDYKGSGEPVTFTECITYNKWMREAPVYIVEGENPESGPFIVRWYLGGNWKPDPPNISYGEAVFLENWIAFGDWERELRREYRRRGGWNGNLNPQIISTSCQQGIGDNA